MKVFVTGATGFVGSAIVQELRNAGHDVLGLARSDAGALSLAAAGAEVHRGSLDDLESLRAGAAVSDGVIHTAFIHDFGDIAPACEADRLAIETIGKALAGSGRPFIVTGGTPLNTAGRPATEADMPPPIPGLPRVSEPAGLALTSQGVRVSVMRLPRSVHGEGDHGFVPRLIEIAREKGVSGYVGDGLNRWPAVHRIDAAHLYRLALENAPAGTILHAVGDEGIPTREIAAMIGRHLDVPVVSVSPEETANHFGWLGAFFALDCPASSVLSQERFGWHSTQPGLLADLDHAYYFPTPAAAT